MAGRGPQAQALGWFCRKLLLQKELDQVTLAEIMRKSGVKDSQLSRIRATGEGVGLEVAERLSGYFEFETVPAMWLAALDWWERGGKAEAAKVIKARAAERIKSTG